MTNKEIFKAAIEKAIKNRWDWNESRYTLYPSNAVQTVNYILNGHELLLLCNAVQTVKYIMTLNTRDDGKLNGHELLLLFDKSWAKAFWKGEVGLSWHEHQHRLLEEIQSGRDPIRYLERFI